MLSAFYHGRNPVSHHVDAYNQFLTVDVPRVILETCHIKGTHGGKSCALIPEKVTLVPPSLSVPGALFTKSTYTMSVRTSFRVHIQCDQVSREYTCSTVICALPLMLGCCLDTAPTSSDPVSQQGCFVVNGKLKTVVMQETMCNNTPIITTALDRHGRRQVLCQFRSLADGSYKSTSTLKLVLTASGVTVDIPYLGRVDIVDAWVLLGVRTTTRIMSLMLHYACEHTTLVGTVCTTLFSHRILDTPEVVAQRLCAELGCASSEHLLKCIRREVLPHVGPCERTKAEHLGDILRQMILVKLHLAPCTDRNSYNTKRVQNVRFLLGTLLRQSVHQYVRTCSYNLLRTLESGQFLQLSRVLQIPKITQKFQFAFATGKWGFSARGEPRDGVVQVLTTTNQSSVMSHLRRLNTNINRDGAQLAPRQVHPSTYGVLCCAETPEGKSCGLIKSLAQFCHIRCAYRTGPIDEYLQRQLDFTLPASGGAHVRLNGRVLGHVASSAQELYEWLRGRRALQILPYDVELLRDVDCSAVQIWCDGGGAMIPLLRADRLARASEILDTLPPSFQWSELMRCGCVEYMGVQEARQSWVYISSTVEGCSPDHTHVEVHPTSQFGINAACIPFPEHNQAPRNIYATVMTKQAVPNTETVCAGYADVDIQPELQLPLTRTRTYLSSPLRHAPLGVNVMLGIMSMSYNQEDSLIMNRASLERGLFRTLSIEYFSCSESLIGKHTTHIGNPEHAAIVHGKQHGDYSKLSSLGFAPPGTTLEQGTVLLQAYTKIKRTKREVHCQDCSILYQGPHPGVVDSVRVCSSARNELWIQLKVVVEHMPETGDKLCSTCGQKGVVGAVVAPEDMPFNLHGETLDVVINPHAIPSRMTVGLLLEMISGVSAVVTGAFQDGTAFQATAATGAEKVSLLQDTLRQHGYAGHGAERFVDGRTGAMLPCLVFSGLAYYHRLKHMVRKKIHARHTGPTQLLTRQPIEGRARNGGLRIGEMERDALIAHGAAYVLRERLCLSADATHVDLCTHCGLLLTVGHVCSSCDTNETVSITLPYAFKLLTDELEACHIDVRLRRIRQSAAAAAVL